MPLPVFSSCSLVYFVAKTASARRFGIFAVVDADQRIDERIDTWLQRLSLSNVRELSLLTDSEPFT